MITTLLLIKEIFELYVTMHNVVRVDVIHGQQHLVSLSAKLNVIGSGVVNTSRAY